MSHTINDVLGYMVNSINKNRPSHLSMDQLHATESALFDRWNYDAPVHEPAPIVMPVRNSMTPSDMPPLTPVPANWGKTVKRRGNRRARSDRRVLDIQRLDAGTAEGALDASQVAMPHDSEAAELGALGFSVKDRPSR
jgi:hypothetical protein